MLRGSDDIVNDLIVMRLYELLNGFILEYYCDDGQLFRVSDCVIAIIRCYYTCLEFNEAFTFK